MLPTLKILLVGDPSVGKQTFASRFLTAEFEKSFPPTSLGSGFSSGITVYPLRLNTNFGPFQAAIWLLDQNLKSQLSESDLKMYYADAEAAILMFDVTARQSYINIPEHYQALRNNTKLETAICLVGNKVDQMQRMVKAKHIVFHRKKNLQYYDMSAKSNYQIEKPFLWLIRYVTQNPEILLVEAPLLASPDVALDYARHQQTEAELAAAAAVALPDEDEDE